MIFTRAHLLHFSILKMIIELSCFHYIHVLTYIAKAIMSFMFSLYSRFNKQYVFGITMEKSSSPYLLKLASMNLLFISMLLD